MLACRLRRGRQPRRRRSSCSRPSRRWRAGCSPARCPDELDGLPQTGARCHVVVLDYGAKASIVRLLEQAGAVVTVLPARRDGGAGRRARARRRAARERARRPRLDGRARRRGARDGRPGASALRHLPRPPVARPRARAGDVQAAVRASRRQPPGVRERVGPRARDEPEPRLRGAARPRTATARSRSRTARSTTARSRACGCAAARSGACSSTPRPRPGRTTRARSWPSSSRPAPCGQGGTADAAPRRSPHDRDHRLRPDRDRPGLRVRLLRRPGAQGAARGGLSHGARQLEPGHDHDRPGLGRRDLPRAARPRGRDGGAAQASGPTRCCRRWAGQTALNLAMELERAGVLAELEHRADRRLREGDPHGRGPRGVRAGDGLGRPARAALGDRAHARGGARRDRRRAAAAGRDPARRSRSAATAAASRARRRSSTRSSAAASTRARSRRCSSRSRSRAGASSSSR